MRVLERGCCWPPSITVLFMRGIGAWAKL